MKYTTVKDLKNEVYSVTFNVDSQSPEFLELISDRGQALLSLGGKLTKTVIEVVVTKTPIVDTNGDAVLDVDGNPTFNTVETPVERVTTLLDLPSAYKYFPKEFNGLTRSFSKIQYPNAEDIADAYAELIESRVKVIVDEYKANPDNFSSEKEVIL